MVAAPEGLIHGPLSAGTVHLCLDMQLMFGPEGPWPTPWMERVRPVVAALAERFRGANIFTRFIPPASADEEVGTWRRFYRRWPQVTRENLDPRLIELLPELAAFAPPAPVVDKARFSAFSTPELSRILNAGRVDTLIVTGAETDICVLATVLDAVDHGYRVIVVEDALCSSSDAGHDALMTLYRQRFGVQIETVTSDLLLRRAA